MPSCQTEIEKAELERLTALALDLASTAHWGQKRNHSKIPYITHPVAVAERLRPDLKPIALLHDTIEDTHITEEFLRTRFPAWIVDRVVMLTRGGREYELYITELGEDEATRRVKTADLDDNLNDLKTGSLRDKYRLAKTLLNVMACYMEVKQMEPAPVQRL